MSKIEQLIKRLCPNGVEYKPLNEIFRQFSGMTGVSNKWKETGNCKFIDYMNAYKNLKIDVNRLENATVKKIEQNKLKKGDILLTSASETPDECALSSVIEDNIADNVFMDDHLFGIRIKDEYKEYINTTYINYYMHTNSFRKEVFKAVRGVTRFYISVDTFMNIKVAVPPLEVQCEIVRVLDNFTLLSAELSAELKARENQYDYYLEKIFDSINADIVSVGEACEIVTDYVAAGSFADIAKNVKYLNQPNYAQLVRTVDIKNKFKKSDYIYVDENAYNYLWRVNLKEECVILPNIGVNCGEVYFVTPDQLIYKNNVLGPNAILLRSLKNNNKYLSYFFKTRDFQKQLRKIISPAGQTKFNKTELKKLKIKLPSVETQRKIADRIEKFDNIINDISEGLPAEIEARQKQYEYYRDKLLTFKELKVNEG